MVVQYLIHGLGEIETEYSSVLAQPALPVFPNATVRRWNVVLDAISVNGVGIPIKSSVRGAPKYKAIALLDTGTSIVRGPRNAVNAIYERFLD